MTNLGLVAKLLVMTGIIVTAIGIIFLFADRLPWMGKLPGDIYIQRKNFSIYIPVTTCVIISILLSAIFYFLTRR